MTCTFFGHSNAPKEVIPTLKCVLVDLIENKNTDTFYVGNHGHFDYYTKLVLKELEEIYSIKYYVVLAYIPQKEEYADYSDTLYPDGVDIVPYRSRINYRNKWMLKKSDIVVTYVKRIIGSAAEYKILAEKQNKTVINLAE